MRFLGMTLKNEGAGLTSIRPILTTKPRNRNPSYYFIEYVPQEPSKRDTNLNPNDIDRKNQKSSS